MIKEKGILPVGVECDGKVHREFEIRPQLVGDSVDAMEDEKARGNDAYMGLVVLSKQLVRLGDIPKEKITAPLLMEMYDVDLAEMHSALGRLQKRLTSFRGEGKTPEKADSGADETGLQAR
jgi:hypothetical protein